LVLTAQFASALATATASAKLKAEDEVEEDLGSSKDEELPEEVAVTARRCLTKGKEKAILKRKRIYTSTTN
jgi:hypothetical protein